MICKKCGKEFLNFEKECPYCGTVPGEENTVVEEPVVEEQTVVNETQENKTPVTNIPQTQSIGSTSSINSALPESQVLGICAIVFCALCASWIGLALAVGGFFYYKQEEGKKKCKIALIIFVVEMILSVILGFILGILGALSGTM